MFFFKQKTAYEMRISDWSSDVCSSDLYEYSRDVGGTPLFGYIGGKPYTGVDLNGDGDLLDAVTILQPSQTQTHRYGVIASLRYDLSDTQSVRVAYSYDRARHRQTGRIGLLQANGNPFDVFPINDPVIAADGRSEEHTSELQSLMRIS